MQGTSVSAGKTLIQVATANGGLIAVTRWWMEQSASATSEQVRVQLLRKSAAATVTSFTPLKTNPSMAASGCVGGTNLTGTNASVEGTDTDIIFDRGGNLLQGFEWVAASRDEWIWVPESSFIGLKLVTTPAAARTISAGIEWVEFA